MLTEREKRVVGWLRRKKVANMRELRQQFDISHMTVVRALNKHGYFSSYSHNASYYTLRETPRFDDWGLWTFGDVHFSQHGTLKNTLVALVEQSPAGRTTDELTARLHGDVPHLLSRLVKQGGLTRQTLSGRRVVYLAANPQQRERQWRRRQAQPPTPAAVGLPAGINAVDVIAILRRMIIDPKGDAQRWADDVHGVTADQVARVVQYYGLKKNA